MMEKRNWIKLLAPLMILLLTDVDMGKLQAQSKFSTARIWNEVVLIGIRNDFARPTVHARNLFHTSIAMYDAFAAYDDVNETYLLGKTIGNYTSEFLGVPPPDQVSAARQMAMSYAVYRLIQHRFKDSPRKEITMFNTELVFSSMGYDNNYTSTDYTNGNPAALGNYIAQSIIELGMTDGSNEENDYKNQYYLPVNDYLNPFIPFYDPVTMFGNPRPSNPNNWQPLEIPGFTDQAGNVIEDARPEFLGAEWGKVTPFALTDADLSIYDKDGNDYWVYHDPGPPWLMDVENAEGETDDYRWGFTMVAHWRNHTILDTNVIYDISPASIGNLTEMPTDKQGIKDYYNYYEGGDYSEGHAFNPYTGEPYEPQLVPRADYARVTAEFWADGPESETPPGHWFTILNYVNDQPELEKRYKGEQLIVNDLEWDVKAYLALGGAMHDAAISAWSCKGYYDYVRPITAIRYMLDRGQSSDPALPNYDPLGVTLIPGSIEQILQGDPLLAPDMSNFGNIKLFSTQFEGDTFFFEGRLWMPYQAFTFVTPPFAGYVSGHSTFSRAAAEVLTEFTGDEFFPGGMGEYFFEEDTYLDFAVFGPSVSLSLQWATYRDAANQSALSRIWGGIHPPVDDIPGRIIGEKVGQAAFAKVDSLFGEPITTSVIDRPDKEDWSVYPNPAKVDGRLFISTKNLSSVSAELSIFDSNSQLVRVEEISGGQDIHMIDAGALGLVPGTYYFQLEGADETVKVIMLK